MRHLKSGRKLNRTSSHRKAMLSNLAVSILDKERVTTTVAKAKEVRSVVERLITYGKKGSLHGIRLAERRIKNKDVLKKLFDDIAPGYKDREGGYTRILRLSERRGDNAEMAIIELVGREGDEQRTRKKKKKAAPKKSKAAVKSEAAEVEATESVTEEVVKEEAAPKKKKAAPKKAKAKKADEPKAEDSTEKETTEAASEPVAESQEESTEKTDAAEGDDSDK